MRTFTIISLIASVLAALVIISCGNANLANPNCYNLNSLINYGLKCDLPQNVIKEYAIQLTDKCFSDNFQDELRGLTICEAIRSHYGQLHH